MGQWDTKACPFLPRWSHLHCLRWPPLPDIWWSFASFYGHLHLRTDPALLVQFSRQLCCECHKWDPWGQLGSLQYQSCPCAGLWPQNLPVQRSKGHGMCLLLPPRPHTTPKPLSPSLFSQLNCYFWSRVSCVHTGPELAYVTEDNFELPTPSSASTSKSWAPRHLYSVVCFFNHAPFGLCPKFLTLSTISCPFLQLNNQRVALPVWPLKGRVAIRLSGIFVLLYTNFGLQVRYDGKHLVEVTVPSSYTGSLCGMCGKTRGDICPPPMSPLGVLRTCQPMNELRAPDPKAGTWESQREREKGFQMWWYMPVTLVFRR